jgi:CRISPR/Cas system-associated endonuclease Cas1
MSNNERFDPLNEPIAYLDPNDPEDKEMIDSIDAMHAKTRERYPNALDVVDDYRNGYVDSSILSSFTADEVEQIRAESDRRNQADSAGKQDEADLRAYDEELKRRRAASSPLRRPSQP